MFNFVFLLLISRVLLLFYAVGLTCFTKCFVLLDVRVLRYVCVFHIVFCAAGSCFVLLDSCV